MKLKDLSRSLYLVALAHLALELCANFLPVIYPVVIVSMGLTYAQVGLIALVFVAGASISQPIFGYLSDRWNPQHITVLSIGWIGLIMGLVGFAWDYASLLVFVGLGSLGSAAFHPAGASIALTHSGRRRGTGLSVFSVGGNIGSALSPIWVAIGLTWWGLRGTIVIIPLALIMSAALHYYLSRDRLTGSVPQGSTQAASEVPAAVKPGSLFGLSLVIVAVMGRNWIQFGLITYIPEWMQNQGWSLTTAGQILSVVLIALSIGSLIGGPLSDLIGRWQVVALSMGGLIPALALALATTGLWQVGMLGLTGTLLGLTLPVTIVMAQEIWPKGVGVATSLVLGIGWLPGGIGASITGWLADQSSLETALQTLVIPPLVGLICIAIYAVSQRKVIRYSLSDAQ